jgi:inhibitor of cysteine peptidase
MLRLEDALDEPASSRASLVSTRFPLITHTNNASAMLRSLPKTGATMPLPRLLALLSLSLLAACAQQPRHIVMLEEQGECPVSLKTGQVLMLSLPSSPSTGYRWQIQDPASAVLHSMGPEVYNSSAPAGMVGSPGISVWRYQANTAGTGHLLMVYHRPWEVDVPPAQTFDCTITVN